jgi:hypothetical protein
MPNDEKIELPVQVDSAAAALPLSDISLEDVAGGASTTIFATGSLSNSNGKTDPSIMVGFKVSF